MTNASIVASAVISFMEVAVNQQEKRSTTGKRYQQPLLEGRGPTRSTRKFSKQPEGVLNWPNGNGDLLWRMILPFWHETQH